MTRSGSPFFKGAPEQATSPNDANMTIVDPFDVEVLSEQQHFTPFLIIIVSVLLIGFIPLAYSKLKPKGIKLWEKIKKKIDERKK